MDEFRRPVGVPDLHAWREHRIGDAHQASVGRVASDVRHRREPGRLQCGHRREDRLRIEAARALEMAHDQVAEGSLAVEILIDRVRLAVEAHVDGTARVVEDHRLRVVRRALDAMLARPARPVARLHDRRHPVEQGAVPLHRRAHRVARHQQGLHDPDRAHCGRPSGAREHGDLADERAGSQARELPLAAGVLLDHDGLAFADQHHLVAALALAHEILAGLEPGGPQLRGEALDLLPRQS